MATDEELEEVAGGKQGDRPFDLQACLDDYNPNDWCWFTDKCYGMSVHYSRYGLCKDTYEPQERCAFTDRCNAAPTGMTVATAPKVEKASGGHSHDGKTMHVSAVARSRTTHMTGNRDM